MDDRQRHAAELRQAGQFAEAASLWRTALRAAPDDWHLALELKADLAAGYHYPESDSVFRRAARSLPDEQFLAHYAPLWTFHGEDLPFLAQRARAVLARSPGHPDANRLLGSVLIQQRRWAAAERHFARAPASPETEANHALAKLYQRLTRCLPERGDYEIAVINLDSNPGRLRDIAAAFRSTKVPRRRIPGVQGSLLPMAAVHRLAPSDGPSMRGTLGCFLSHAAAWDAMLARGLAHCLIIEDDVVPQLPLPPGLGALGLPDGFDLCFVNDRMQPVWPASRIAASAAFQAVPLAESFATFPPENNAPGAGRLHPQCRRRPQAAWLGRAGRLRA